MEKFIIVQNIDNDDGSCVDVAINPQHIVNIQYDIQCDGFDSGKYIRYFVDIVNNRNHCYMTINQSSYIRLMSTCCKLNIGQVSQLEAKLDKIESELKLEQL